MRPSALLLIVLFLTPSSARSQTAPWPLCTDPGDQTDPRQGGGIFWVDARDPSGPDLYFSFENYSNPQPFIAATGWQTNFSVDPALPICGGPNPPPEGTLYSMVVWMDSRSGDLDLRVKPHHLGGGPPPSDLPLCSASGFQTDARIVRAAFAYAPTSSSWIVGWLDRRNGADRHVYAQRVDDTGASQWTANGVPVCTLSGFSSNLDVVADGAGGAYLAWTQEGAGVRIQRITSAGTAAPGWPMNGLPVSGATAATASQPRIVADGSGGVLVVWDDLRATGQPIDGDIYAQHLTGSGTLASGWPVNGLPVTTAFQVQSIASVVTDAAGGMIVVWSDARNAMDEQLSPDVDVRALRITGSGIVAPGWDADGKEVCGRPFLQSNATAIPDGEGGVYIAWEDVAGSTAPTDIRASHLTANGSLPWIWPADGSDGVVICDAPGDQTTPSLGFGCDGRLLVVWVDERDAATTGKDIYAVNMSPYGRVDAPDPVVPTRFALAAPVPNPSRSSSSARLDLPEATSVEASIVDPAGRRVATLVAGERWSAGTHELRWYGRDASGGVVPTGVYFMQVRAGTSSAVRRIVLMR